MSTTTMNDAELVTAYRAGDRSAFAAMYDRYGNSLYDTAAAMVRNRDDAADLTQDVFVIAAERIEQLRDPSRLKPWLFAILRNEVYRRSGKNKRIVVTDFTEPVAEMQLPGDDHDEASALEYDELAEMVRAAAGGLDERDQLVLELSVRQGLSGNDLADALGVSPQQSYGMVHRMRQRTERSLGAYCVARKGRKECGELDAILRGWDGDFSVLIRKRVARHVEQCETCEKSRRKFAPFALYGAAPAFAAPADLRDRVLAATGTGGAAPAYGFSAPGGFPSIIKYGRKIGLWLALGALALLVATGTTAYVLAADDETPSARVADTTTTTVAGTTTVPTTTVVTGSPAAPTSTSVSATSSTTSTTSSTPASTTSSSSTSSTTTTIVGALSPTTFTTTPQTTLPSTTTTAPPATTATTPPPVTTTTTTPGSLLLSAGSIDFGTTVNQAVVTLSNPGGQPVNWLTGTGPVPLRGAPSPFSFSPTNGTLAPGATVKVTFNIDRSWPTEGPLEGESVRFFSASEAAEVVLSGAIARAPTIRLSSVPAAFICQKTAQGLFWQIGILDESPPLSAAVVVTHPNGSIVTVPMGQDGTSWYGGVTGDLDGDGLVDFGVFSWTMRATDAFGNSSTADGTASVGVDSNHC